MENGSLDWHSYPILVADDSTVVRDAITQMLREEGFQEILEASNGREALTIMDHKRPVIAIIDLVMPELDGLHVLEVTTHNTYQQVFIISSFEEEVRSVAPKIRNTSSLMFVSKQNSLVETIRARIQVIKHGKFQKRNSPTNLSYRRPNRMVFTTNHPLEKDLVILGGSSGGIKAVEAILSQLIPPTPPIIVVQHHLDGFTQLLVERFALATKLSVTIPQDHCQPLHSCVYVVPSNHILSFQIIRNQVFFRISYDSSEVIQTPPLDPTITFASWLYQRHLTVIVLSGMGRDGLAGTKVTKECRGTVLIQHKRSCVVFGMPKVIKEGGLSDLELSPMDIGNYLNLRFGSQSSKNLPTS